MQVLKYSLHIFILLSIGTHTFSKMNTINKHKHGNHFPSTLHISMCHNMKNNLYCDSFTKNNLSKPLNLIESSSKPCMCGIWGISNNSSFAVVKIPRNGLLLGDLQEYQKGIVYLLRACERQVTFKMSSKIIELPNTKLKKLYICID